MTMKHNHTRRHRRQGKMKIRSGSKFKVRHASKSGRTGSIHNRQVKPS